MQVYGQKFPAGPEENEDILCVVDIQKPALVFALGDECQGPEDDNVFYIHRCGPLLQRCAAMASVLDTLTIGQESAHWLSDAILIAEKQGAFENLASDMLGAYMYQEYEMDVIYAVQ